MAEQNLNTVSLIVDDGNDSIVIQEFVAGIQGGATLSVTGLGLEVIPAGTVIVQNNSTKEYEVHPLNAGKTAYATTVTGKTYAGIWGKSTLTSKPTGSIMTIGQVNDVVAPFAITQAIANALPNIKFTTVQAVVATGV